MLILSKQQFESVKLLLKLIVIIKNTKNGYLNNVKHKSKYLINAPINDNEISRKIIISIKFSKI